MAYVENPATLAACGASETSHASKAEASENTHSRRLMQAVRQRCCRDCGASIRSDSKSKEFCSATCRSAFHNRRKQRGADLYDLFMSLRFDRGVAQDKGAWSLMCRMAALFRLEDQRDRAGSQSWDSIEAVRRRNPHLDAKVISANAAGARRSSGAAA